MLAQENTRSVSTKSRGDLHILGNELPRYGIEHKRCPFWEGYVKTHSEIDLSAGTEDQLKLDDDSNFVVVVELKFVSQGVKWLVKPHNGMPCNRMDRSID